jgi:hypothetical protein
MQTQSILTYSSFGAAHLFGLITTGSSADVEVEKTQMVRCPPAIGAIREFPLLSERYGGRQKRRAFGLQGVEEPGPSRLVGATPLQSCV